MRNIEECVGCDKHVHDRRSDDVIFIRVYIAHDGSTLSNTVVSYDEIVLSPTQATRGAVGHLILSGVRRCAQEFSPHSFMPGTQVCVVSSPDIASQPKPRDSAPLIMPY